MFLNSFKKAVEKQIRDYINRLNILSKSQTSPEKLQQQCQKASQQLQVLSSNFDKDLGQVVGSRINMAKTGNFA